MPKNNRRVWTDEERAIIRKYAHLGARETAKHLDNRNEDSILKCAQRLGVRMKTGPATAGVTDHIFDSEPKRDPAPDRLLARLLKFHGDNPPDDESKAAVARLKRLFKPEASPTHAATFQPEPFDLDSALSVLSVVYLPSNTIDNYEVVSGGKMRRIVEDVARTRGVGVDDILSDRRSHYIIAARHEAMWRCHKETGYSFPRIGRFFGKDHTTVLSACRTHEARMAERVAA